MTDQFADAAVRNASDPMGKKHLHFVWSHGRGEWLVRFQRGVLCGTPRCQLVTIKEQS